MDMMSQLIDAKVASGGQQWEKEESRGTGRGAAHNYSVGTGRASPTTDTGYGITAVGAAVATEVSVHNRRAAPEPTRPADDIGRRPDVSAGVGPTVHMNSGEARELHLAGMAAHDGGSDVLNSSFHGRPRVIPPMLKRERASKRSGPIFF